MPRKSRSQKKAEQSKKNLEDLKKAAHDWNKLSQAQKTANRRWGKNK